MEIKLFGLTIDTETITDRQKLVAGGVVGLVVLALGFYANKPAYDQLVISRDEITQLETTKDAKKLKVLQINKVRQEYNDLLARINLIQQKIPRQDNIPALLVDLEKISRMTGVEMKTFLPSSLTPINLPAAVTGGTKTGIEDKLRELPIKFEVIGSYPDVVALFGNLERYERTLNADNIALAPGGGPATTEDKSKEVPFISLNISFDLKAYVLLEG